MYCKNAHLLARVLGGRGSWVSSLVTTRNLNFGFHAHFKRTIAHQPN